MPSLLGQLLRATPAVVLCLLYALLTTLAAGAPVLGRHPGGSDSAYNGAPALDTAGAIVTAGGGPDAFKTTTLLGVLAGSNAHAAIAALVRESAAADVKQSVATLDFVVTDALRLAKRNGLVLAHPAFDPLDGRALSTALHAVGAAPSTGRFSVEYLLDHILTHALHVRIMRDVDAAYGVHADAAFKRAVTRIMNELAVVVHTP